MYTNLLLSFQEVSPFLHRLSHADRQPISHPPAHNTYTTNHIRLVRPFKSVGRSLSPAADLYTHIAFLLRTVHRFSHCVIRTHKQPPVTQLLVIHTSGIASATSASPSLSVSLHLQQQACTHTYLFLHILSYSSHCINQTHKQHTSRPPNHNTQITNNIKHVTHFKAPRLSSSPTTDLDIYFPVSLHTVWHSSHCCDHTHKQSTSHRSSHSTQNITRHQTRPPL